MTKSELISNIMKRYSHGLPGDVEPAISAIIEYLSESLANGQRIEVRGFGAFSRSYRAAKIGRNPRTGEPVPIPGKHRVVFKPGKVLSDRVIASQKTEASSIHIAA